MYAALNIENSPLKVNIFRRLLILLLSVCALQAAGQNLNNPNKKGPMGTQVNTYSGNLFIERHDIRIPARAFNINVSFAYNSYNYSEEEGFGRGWSFHYGIRYKNDTTVGGKIIVWGDGREDNYDSIPGGNYRTPKGFFNTLSLYQAGKYKLTELDGTTSFFDNAIHKKITRMQEPNGNFINFIYTDSLLTSMVNTAGQSISFNYANGRLAIVTDAIASPSRSYTYTYDNYGNLQEVVDPLGGKNKYTYLVNGPMKTITDKNNNTVNIIYYPDYSASELIGCNKRMSFSYDTSSHSTVTTDHLSTGNQVTKYTYQQSGPLAWLISMSGNCCGFNTSYEYDEAGNLAKQTDANNNITTYSYDANGNLLSIKDPLNRVSTYTYSAVYNRIASYTDFKGNKFNLSYDANGNLVQLVTPGNNIYTAVYNATGDISSSTDPKGNVYSYSYDAVGNPTQVTGPNGYTATLSFDARGNLLAFTDARGNHQTAEFDILDRLKKITDPLNNFSLFNYDAEGNMVSLVNKNNENTTVNYDASNRPVKITGPVGNQVNIGYDGMNNILSFRNEIGNEVKFAYDTRNLLKNTIDPDNNNAVLNRDAYGNISSISLPNGRTLSYTYDALNRITKVTDAAGTIASLTYDANGNISTYTNGTGAITSVVYDSLDRRKQITDPLGNSSFYTYDKNNNVASVTDRNNRSRFYTYDSLDRIKTFTDNNGFVITMSYDTKGNVIQLKDQNNNITTYTYDSLDRRKTMTLPDNKFLQYGYDKKGNLTSKRLTDATTINYVYDALNRLITKTLPGGEVYSYTYDAVGRLLTATNSKGTVTFTYDALNRLLSENFDGRTTRYSYSIAGRTQTTLYPDSSKVSREYDTRNRLIKIMKDSVTVVEYAYNNANQLTGKTFANGVGTVLQYDFANRLSSMVTSAGTIQNTSFTYDKEMNRVNINRLNAPALSEQFSYDNTYRLTNYKRGVIGGSPAIQNTYVYDAVGNRTSANLDGTATTYNTNNLNQLTAINGTGLTYDNRGNLSYDGVFYKTYDAENRLVKDSSSPASVISYGYDAMSRRVTKTTNGVTLRYGYSRLAQIEERNNSNVLLSKTVFSKFLSPVMNEKNGAKYYFHQNDLNSVEAITNSSGRLTEQYRYDVYGMQSRYDSINNPLSYSPSGNRFGFTGQEYDSATNSYRFFFRNYSPQTGSFAQRDLIEYEDKMGMYQYAGNNPANGIDIFGLDCGDAEESPVVEFNDYYNEKNGHFGNCLSIYSTTMELTGETWFGNANTVKSINYLSSSTQLISSYESLQKAAPHISKEEYHIRFAEIVAGGAGLSGDIANDAAGKYGGEAAQGVIKAVTLPIKAFGYVDALSQEITGKSLARHYAEMDDGAQQLGRDIALSSSSSQRRFDRAEEQLEFITKKWGSDQSNWTDEWIEMYDIHEDAKEVGFTYSKKKKVPCPPTGGTRKGSPLARFGQIATMRIRSSDDPNEIIGPDGQPTKKWVSINDRLPYTILYENSKVASAPAKYVKITSPVDAKADPGSFQLGGFGFNNLTFTVPNGTAAYNNRLDCRDSLGLYVDVIAGYDQLNNQAFWEFQAIDPATLLPPDAPLAGFLLLQDSIQVNHGHGYVNFSIKPVSSAHTLDSIRANASILFDHNDTIPTNIAKNTIDAVAPTSSMTNLPDLTPNTEVTLHYTGSDDPGGSGVKWYSIYIADDNAAPALFVSDFKKTDTTFYGIAGHLYRFYASATDTAGNVESLKLLDSVLISNGEYVICPGSNTVFDSRMTGSTFQWQVNNGTGFTNVSNGGIYNGANTAVLQVSGAGTFMYGSLYRCLLNGTTYSPLFLLKFGMTWEGSVNTAWENPANWSCGSLPDANTDVIINGGKIRYPLVNSNVMVRTLRMNPGASGTVVAGFTLTVVK